MKSFKSFISEGKYPLYLRILVGGIVLKIKSVENMIRSEKDVGKKMDLISYQNSLLSYISGLGIGVGTKDNVLMSKLRKGIGGGGKR
tara:strand:- start:296 stop:556 length:261 start_codon:yes stop_codon:yes gene_type:complete